MTSFANELQAATRRGNAFLADIAGTVAGGQGTVEGMLDEVCHDAGDWACILLALGAWDPANEEVGAAIGHIVKAAKAYCAEKGA